jgi:HK97 family phage portal protein
VSFLKKAAKRRVRAAQAFTEEFWTELGLKSLSGVHVTPEKAMQVMAVLACLRVLAEGVAQVPIKVFKRKVKGRGADVADDHPLHRILYRKPNPWQTSFELREQIVLHVALAGRFVAFVNRVRGQVREIIPFLPNEVCVERDANYNLTYRVTAPDGTQRVLPASAVWHIKGLSWSGWEGLEIIKLAREAIGLAAATEESHALMHANGAQTSGVYSIDSTLNTDQYRKIRDWIDASMTGANRHKPFVLDRGAKFFPTAMSGVDSQHLETRKYQVEEVCRAWRVFPQMVGFTDKTSTFASAEQFFQAHVIHTLMPWYERIEQSADVSLLTEQEAKDGYYVKFLPNALMRGAAADRASFYNSMFNLGALSPNEIREMEECNPYEGGDTYRVGLNMTDASLPVPEPAAPSGPKPAGGGNTSDPAATHRRQQPLNVGRVLSGRNETRIREAEERLQAVLDELGPEQKE